MAEFNFHFLQKVFGKNLPTAVIIHLFAFENLKRNFHFRSAYSSSRKYPIDATGYSWSFNLRHPVPSLNLCLTAPCSPAKIHPKCLCLYLSSKMHSSTRRTRTEQSGGSGTAILLTLLILAVQFTSSQLQKRCPTDCECNLDQRGLYQTICTKGEFVRRRRRSDS